MAIFWFRSANLITNLGWMLPQSASHSFIVKAAAAGSTLGITDYNLCSLVLSLGKELYLFTNTNWIVPGVENVILRLSAISYHLATAAQ